MAIQATEQKTDLSAVVDKVVRIKGNGTGNPTVEKGVGVTVTRSALGVLTFAFRDNPGNFVCAEAPNFESSTPSSLAGWSAVANNFVLPTASTLASVAVSIFNSTFAASDLAATQWITVVFKFQWAGAGV